MQIVIKNIQTIFPTVSCVVFVWNKTKFVLNMCRKWVNLIRITNVSIYNLPNENSKFFSSKVKTVFFCWHRLNQYKRNAMKILQIIFFLNIFFFLSKI